MPKTIVLCNMAAKYLVDHIGHNSWMDKGHLDMFASGQMLAEVLPRFEAPPAATDPVPAAETPGTEVAAPAAPVPMYVTPLESPVAPFLTEKGEIDWPRMSREESTEFRKKVAEHNQKFLVWCRAPLPRPITLTDGQLEIGRRVLKHYAPRPEADKDKDKEKQKQPRPELPANEFTLQLLRAFDLTS